MNSVTVMVGAVVLGIAVDNSIHVLAFWNDERGSSSTPKELHQVLMRKLSAMACTTAVLTGGLGLFLFSSFPPVADFGGLAILALCVALLSTLFLLAPLVGYLFKLDQRPTGPDLDTTT